jgi:GNAT superfamily N-acetyltransferase
MSADTRVPENSHGDESDFKPAVDAEGLLYPDKPEVLISEVTGQDIDEMAKVQGEAYGDYDGDRDAIQEELLLPGATTFSRIIRTEGVGGSTEMTAFLLASRAGENGVYVSELTVRPEAQRSGIGLTALLDLLATCERERVSEIKFHARAETSYQALQQPSIQKIIADHGYKIGDEPISKATSMRQIKLVRV